MDFIKIHANEPYVKLTKQPMKTTILTLAASLLSAGVCQSALPGQSVVLHETGKNGSHHVLPANFCPGESIGRVKNNPGFPQASKGDLKWSVAPASDLRAPKSNDLLRKNAPTKANGDGLPTLMGCVSYADSWNITGIGLVGIYEIGADEFTQVSLHENMLTSYGQVYAGTKYFATEPILYGAWVYDMYYNIFDTRDWSETRVQGNYNFNARAMAFDPVSRRAYAVTKDDYTGVYYLSVMDMDTYGYRQLGQLGTEDWSALMCSGKGEVYGIKKSGELGKFDKVTGAYTLIGQTGLPSAKMTSATIDPATGRCLYVHYTGSSSDLYEIDLDTATPEFLYAIPENAQILSLFVPEAQASEGAPAAPQQLELNFSGPALKGTFSFLLPSATVGGTALDGTLSYSVLLNGIEEISGEGAPGEDVSCELTLPASGEYTFTVKVSNAEGEGELASVTSWMGFERPAAPADVALKVEDNLLSLSWKPVTVSSEDGVVTYTVTSYPSGEVVAENLTEPLYTCEIPVTEELTVWVFGVTAVNGDTHSSESKSNGYISGYLPLPYSQDFESADAAEFFTFIDANDDGRTWSYSFFGEGRLLINYSYSQPHDDWAVLHPVKLEGGKMYTVGCDLKATTSSYTEKIEIIVAEGKDTDSLTQGTVIMPVTDIIGDEYMPYEARFVAEKDGVYYVAFHAVSEAYQNILYLDNVTISTGVSTLAPGQVDSLTVTPDPAGALSAEISFKTPVTDMSGAPLTEITYVAIERDGEEIAQVGAATPGESLSFTDTNPVNGVNNYTVAAYNSYGRGFEAEISAYVGLTEPAAPGNVKVCYGSNTGEAVVTWNAPTLDIAGHALGDTPITYNVKRTINGSTLRTVATGLTELTYTEQAVDAADDQVFVNYIIEAEAVGGVSDGGLSNIYPLGRPELTPAKESFGGRVTDYEWGAEASPYSFTSWDIYPDAELPFDTYDGGSAAVAFNAYFDEDNTAALISSLFDLSGLEKPVLTFYLFDYCDTENSLRISVNNGEAWTELGGVTFGESNFAWKRKSFDLSAFKNQTICIEMLAEVLDFDLIAIDNLRITNDVDYNLATVGITVPESAEPNQKFNVTASYENAGKMKAEGYSIDLLCDDEVIASAEGEPMEPEAIISVSFDVTLPVVASERPVFKAVINYSLDEVAADNATKEASVKFIAPALPAPGNLTAAQNDNEVVLSWDAPNLGDVALTPSVDDIESYTPFSTGLPDSVIDDDNIGEWTMYDVDGLPTYTGTFNYEGVGNPIAYVVYNSYMQEDNVFACHSGHQMFLSLASKPQNGQYNDDWLVSPLLAGCAQTISFYAKSIDTYGADTFQVLYSTTGKEIADFELISEQQSTGEWEEYSFALPEGTTYFAVRCISDDRYAFLLDDFRMITSHDGVSDLEILGYNVYCNGKRVNEGLITDTTFIHLPETDTDAVYHYNVACVFNHGESAPSDTAEVNFIQTGVKDIASNPGINVIADKGEILVKGLSGEKLTVTDAAGITIYSASAEGEVRIPVSAGIYVVKADRLTVKAIVR